MLYMLQYATMSMHSSIKFKYHKRIFVFLDTNPKDYLMGSLSPI